MFTKRKSPVARTLSLMALAPCVWAVEPNIPVASAQSFAVIAALPAVRQAMAFIKTDDANTLAEQKAIVVIAAPTFQEKKRAESYMARL